MLAHTTLRSMEEQRLFAERHGAWVEWIVVLDRADEQTMRMLREHPALRPSDTILMVDHGDPGLSRNEGIARAQGDFIAIFDGDDYFSKNWLWAGAQACSWTERSVFHPQFILSFGETHALQEVADQRAHRQMTPYTFLFSHPLIGALIAPKALFEKIHYISKVEGFGYEDWHLSCEIMSLHYRHCVAKNTFLFYRRKKHGSILKNENMGNSIIRPTALVDVLAEGERSRQLASGRVDEKSSQTLNLSSMVGDGLYFICKKTYRASKKIKHLWDAKLKPNADVPSMTVATSPLDDDRIRQALLDITSVDPALHPAFLPPFHIYCPDLSDSLGRLFIQVYSKIRAQYDIVYIVPWVIVGGADLMTLQYANCMAAHGQKILVISTFNRDSVWASRFDASIEFLELGKFLSDVPGERQAEFLAKLLCQLAPRDIHVINSELGYMTFQKYGSALSSISRLFTTYFCDDELRDGTDVGYAVKYMRSLDNCTTRISTDNTRLIKKWHSLYGIDEAKFSVIRGYIEETNLRDIPLRRKKLHPCHILWAGRLCRQKRPDILLKIAEQMPDLHFDVYGTIEPSDEMNAVFQDLNCLENVTVHGAYDGFSSLPLSSFSCFLYTSQYDGLPNILLEAAASGLPLIAPDIGGIRDFISDRTGCLVSNNEDIDAFVRAITESIDDSRATCARARAAQHLLKTLYSKENFETSLLDFYDLSGNPQFGESPGEFDEPARFLPRTF